MRAHLLTVVLAALSVVLLTFVIPIVVLIHRDLHDRLALRAIELAVQLLPEARQPQPPRLAAPPDDGFTFAILTVPAPPGQSGEPSSAALRTALTSCGPATSDTSDGVEVVLPVRQAGGCGRLVRVVASEAALHPRPELVIALTLSLAVLTTVVAALLAERLARRLVRSVTDLAVAADRMAGGDLSASVIPSGPVEVQRVGHQLNHLAHRVEQLLDERSQRAADLTHRLRTPLTALRLDMDALPDSPATERVLADYDRVTKAVDDVIHLARHAGANGGQRQGADLAQIVRQRIEFWGALAEDTGRSVHHSIPAGPVLVDASAHDLEAIFDAVLGNIFAHTPAGVPFWVEFVRISDALVGVSIDDAGPGFSDLKAIRRGHSNAASTGLGLDIARHTAEASGGYLLLGRSRYGGARVRICFGLVRPAPPATVPTSSPGQ